MTDKTVMLMPGDVTQAQAALMQQTFGRRASGSKRRARSKGKRAKRSGGSARKTTRKRATRSKSRGSRGTSKRSRLVAGSAAAKRHMAKLRAMRKRK